jgi:NAD(P)-dependent dehydrogenase (short-subunit alcohol dehydrogenase family)
MSLACIPALTKTKGHLIMVSSVLSQRPNAGTSIYSATKGGVESFAKALAVELAPKKVRCNVVAPALVATEIYAHAMDSRTFNKFLKERGKVYPIGRAGVPEDISELIAYLASDHTTWMTGVLIPVDGGRMIG